MSKKSGRRGIMHRRYAGRMRNLRVPGMNASPLREQFPEDSADRGSFLAHEKAPFRGRTGERPSFHWLAYCGKNCPSEKEIGAVGRIIRIRRLRLKSELSCQLAGTDTLLSVDT